MSLKKRVTQGNKAQKILSNRKTAKANLNKINRQIAKNNIANLRPHRLHLHHKVRNQANKTQRTHKNNLKVMQKAS